MALFLNRFFVPSAEKIFRQMGCGIRKRNKAFNRYWSEHQQKCFEVQRNWLEQLAECDEVVIIGAGFLLDLECDVFAKRFRKIILIDGNPDCLSVWRKFALNSPKTVVEMRVEEVTNLLELWKQELISRLRGDVSWKDAMKILRSFAKKEPSRSSFYDLASGRAVLSLNILSQLPLSWQDIVEKSLIAKFGKGIVLENEDEWISAFSGSAQILVQQHLVDLSLGKSSLLITDIEYCHYQVDTDRELVEPCVDYHDSQWQRNSSAIDRSDSLKIEVMPALYGVSLDRFVSRRLDWLWHISPPGAESKKNGIAHLVQAGLMRS